MSIIDTGLAAETGKYLRRTAPKIYELTEPHLLYLKPSGAHAYTTAKEDNTVYAHGFHQEIVEVMRQHGRELLKPFMNSGRLALVDLGPGETPDKTEPLLLAARDSGMAISYAPVDVSQLYLHKVSAYVRELISSAEIHPLQTKFEDLDSRKLSELGLKPAYVFLGPTYMNFPPEYSAAFFKKMLPPESFAVVATELLTSDNSAEKIRQQYDNAPFKAFGFGPLENLGCNPDRFAGSINFSKEHQRIEFTYVCTADDRQFKQGDTVITAVSYRTTLQNLEQDLSKNFNRKQILVSPSGNTAVAVLGL